MNKSDNRIYIGNLPQDVRTKDIEDLFYKFGKIKYIDLKNRKGPPFAFVEFEDPLDAEDAVKGRDNYVYEGHKLRVEFQKGPRAARTSVSRSGPPTRRSEYRCIITGLPPTGSWQDLKDHMREAGNVCYADVFKDGTGVVEFIRYEDMKYAVKNLDDTKFRSHEGETSYVRVREDSSRRNNRSISRSRSRSRSSGSRRGGGGRERASPTYSPVRRSRSYDYDDDSSSRRRNKRSRQSRSPSRSRSRSRIHSRSKSTSRSRTRRSKTPHSKSVSPSRSPAQIEKRSRSESKSPARSEGKLSDKDRYESNENCSDGKKVSPSRSRSPSPSS